MATHSSILAWRISWREELSGLQSKRSQSQTQPSESRNNLFLFFLPYFSHIWRTCRRNLLVKRVKTLNVYTYYCIRITSAMNNWRTTQNNLSDKEMYYFTEYEVQRWGCPRANQFCSLATILIFRFFSDFYSAILSEVLKTFYNCKMAVATSNIIFHTTKPFSGPSSGTKITFPEATL